MSDLLWFHGIGWHTPVNEIGWSYVVVVGLGIFLAHTIRDIFR